MKRPQTLVSNPLPSRDLDLRVDDFDYDLPSELIAQEPLGDRHASRLLVVDRATGQLHHSSVRDLGNWLTSGDLLVANNSRVLAARMRGERATGGRAELLLLRREDSGAWSALAKPARRMRPGTEIRIPPRDRSDAPAATATVVERRDEGEVLVALDEIAEANLERYGAVPLPPYITHELKEAERYQTVYASHLGSAAAPTAGLHFTRELIDRLASQGIGWVEVTLHVGLDTFRPVTVERVADHVIHQEWFSVDDDVARRIEQTRQQGGSVVAVGTTAARTLESVAQRWAEWGETGGASGMTGIFITPGYQWQLVDALLTNFHLPKSTLLMMVSSLAGSDLIRHAYEVAVAEKYRFFSFGDAMLIR